MSDAPLYIPLLLGTGREGRQSENVATYLMKKLAARPEVETELFDVRAFDLPPDQYGEALKERNARWRDALARAAALLIVSPEYNHGYPGTLKAALDTLYAEYMRKAVGIAAVSNGPFGGARMVENLLPVLHDLGLVAIKPTLYFKNIAGAFGPDGSPLEADMDKRADAFLDELIWMAQTLRAGRGG